MEEKGAKPDGSWPTFQYSEDANARSVLGTVANRLRRIGESSRRMEWDKPPISLGDYIARLRSRKQQLSRTILDAERTRPKTGRPGPLFQARPTRTMAPLPIDGGRRFELSGRELQVASESWRELAGECRTYEGRVAPVTWWAEDSKKYVTHDSECGAYVQYGYPDETFFRGTGYMEIYQHLYDDASSRGAYNGLPEVSKLRLISLEMTLKPNPTYERLNRVWVNSTSSPSPLGYLDANIYDGLWVLSLSAIRANSTKPLEIMKVLPSVASDYIGATGRCTLDDTGARAGADYDIYAYFEVEGRTRSLLCGGYRWEEGRFTWDNDLLG